MSELHFTVPDDVEKQLRRQAEAANLPLPHFLAELVTRTSEQQAQWTDGYFEKVFGQWRGEPLRRAPQGEYEQRAVFK